MKIGILGSRGIPNRYGGFEQFAEYLSAGLAERGHQVWVYSPHQHPYHEAKLGRVNIIHCYDPEIWLGTAGQFIYDLNCIRDSRHRDFDALLFLGYTSSSAWRRFYPEKPLIITNMDGLEWKRAKYGQAVKRFLKLAEKWAVNSSDVVVADSSAIAKYLQEKYSRQVVTIPYSATVFEDPDPQMLELLNLRPYHYDMLIARLEPENHIEMILQGYLKANISHPFLVIGGTDRKYGKFLRKRFSESRIRFVGGIYDQQLLNNLRYYSRLYFHGHSVGGTNPSLLEAMASSASIVAHDNPFNRAVLGNDAQYFQTPNEVAQLILKKDDRIFKKYIKNNLVKIQNEYSLEKIINGYNLIMSDEL
ncbi:MAG: DUF1972 domain-containing protein [Bacteroidia bacterium]